jgi:hypothetical protein
LHPYRFMKSFRTTSFPKITSGAIFLFIGFTTVLGGWKARKPGGLRIGKPEYFC